MTSLFDEIRIAIHQVWSRRWLALAVAWGLCLAGWLGIAMIPNSYESTARVQFSKQQILNDSNTNSTLETIQQVKRLEQTLTSSVNLEKVIRGTDMGRSVASDREMAKKIEGLREKIEVKADQDQFITITAKQPSGKLARDVVQKLIDVAEEDDISDGRMETGSKLKFLDAQIEARKRELDEAEAKRVAFETQNLGLLPGVGSVSQRLEANRAELNQIESQLVSASSAVAALNGQLAGTPQNLSTPNFGGGVAAANPAAASLAQARADLGAMKARGLTDSHPDVIAQRAQVANLAVQAKSYPSGGSTSGGGAFNTPNPAYSSLQSLRAERDATATALRSRKAMLQAEMTQLASKQTAEPGIAAEMTRLNRDYEVMKQQYDKLSADRDNVSLHGQAETQASIAPLKVINRPTLSNVPAAPNRPLLLAAVLIAGLCAGAGTAFALAQMRSTYPTAAKLEKASGLPVIGSVSQMLTAFERSERARKMKLFYGATAALCGLFVVLIVVEFIQRSLTA
jgi:polysaccharide biosynthesis transport protein